MDIQPSTHYHAPEVRQFNEANRSANIDLSEDALIRQAHRETGLTNLGDEAFLVPLRKLLASLETEAKLNPFGRSVAQRRIVASLKNRLWATACFEAHPEILQRNIVAPIIIIGPHRSGTTRLQRMMATDGRLQYLKAWEGINPAPRIGQPDLGKEARREEVRMGFAKMKEIYPDAFTAHPMDADWAEEENLLLNHSFCGFTPLGLYNIPEFYKWFVNHDKTHGYRYMADLMRLISWSRGDAEDKRWILKNPQHMMDLDVLVKVFPDAKLVFTHRDPLKTVGSVMSLMWFFAAQHTDAPCRASIRDTWLDFCETTARRGMYAREVIPAAQQLDVPYEEVNRDWQAVMRRLYDFAGIEFTPTAEAGMAAWLSESDKEGRHGGHRYSLEDFGTSKQEVDARMMFVREKYNLPYEER